MDHDHRVIMILFKDQASLHGIQIPSVLRNVLYSELHYSDSSILVYHFCKHAQHFCSTWMTSRMQFEKNEG